MGEKTNENRCDSKSYKTQIEDCFRGTTPAIEGLIATIWQSRELLRMLFRADIIIRDLDLCIDMLGACII